MRTFEKVAVVVQDQEAMMGGRCQFVAMGSIRYEECKDEFVAAFPGTARERGGVEQLKVHGALLVKDPLVPAGYFYPVFRV